MNTNRPSHIAYVVEKNPDDTKNDFFRQVGVVWPHKNGTGFDLVLHPQLAISGRIVCTERKEKPEAGPILTAGG